MAGLAAGALDVPWIELIPHPLADPGRGLPPFGTGWWPPRAWRDAPLRALALRQLRSGRRRALSEARSRGYADPEPVLRLVATLPALEPPRPDWPASAQVIGPLAFEAADRDLALAPGDGPMALVVRSSATGAAADLLGLAVEQLAGAGIRIASPSFEAHPGSLPEWAVAGPGRLAPLLAAASVVVAAGGHGLVAAALLAGRPLVLVPGPGDQKEISARVGRLGAALVVRPEQLGAGVRQVLADPSFAQQASAAGRTAQGLPDPVALVLSAAHGL
jgi:UDP:flavonoid glycosyltransferase YjiC (YdhE family)